ncbi:MSHA pilin protein MshD [Pseudoduganella flava]|uniref:MSHA pilin protein MshD n=1 Tax=Pseudoduganella flava TaxID=871742 RepID=A0A562PJE9_9BURK|nr:type II secretion system protein [Pseudoduganella flava]QGZ42767.1 hypothetical protein GO485_29500 [Pseudoduganella flava]TWI44136.1 MSHA pilin protein MshD [Pseudoduganella flava]
MMRSRQRGLTLIELIVFIIVISIAVVAVLQVIGQNTARSADPIRRKQAMAIAEGLLDEVRSAAFTFCDPADPNAQFATSAAQCATTPEGLGPEKDNARPFDNVSDYGAANGAPVVYATDLAGTNFPAGYAATVTVTQAGNLGPGSAMVPATDALRIVVTVTYGNESVTLESYRTRFAPNNF